MKDKLMRAGVDEDGVKLSDRFEVASAATSTEEIGKAYAERSWHRL